MPPVSKPKILVFGANPAWQKTLYFGTFRRGEVNRAEKLELYAGGKGVNFCRAAKCRDIALTRLYQFSGGANGASHEAALAVKRKALELGADVVGIGNIERWEGSPIQMDPRHCFD